MTAHGGAGRRWPLEAEISARPRCRAMHDSSSFYGVHDESSPGKDWIMESPMH
jgi:hypothetical protein